jgi:hypothetical protein
LPTTISKAVPLQDRLASNQLLHQTLPPSFVLLMTPSAHPLRQFLQLRKPRKPRKPRKHRHHYLVTRTFV